MRVHPTYDKHEGVRFVERVKTGIGVVLYVLLAAYVLSVVVQAA